MKKQIFSLIILMLIGIISASCQHLQSSAIQNLKKMRAKDYFDSKLQIGFAEAIARSDTNLMQEFLKEGADVNHIGRQGMTPLFWALSKQSLVGFKFLLENKANPNMQVTNSTEVESQEFSVMQTAAIMEDPQYLKLAVGHGAEVNRTYGVEKQSVIFDAIMNRRIQNVRTLINANANKNLKDITGETPMMAAAEIKQYDIVLILLEAGADPTIKDRWGYDLAALIKRYGARGISPQGDQYQSYLKVVERLKKMELLN